MDGAPEPLQTTARTPFLAPPIWSIAIPVLGLGVALAPLPGSSLLLVAVVLVGVASLGAVVACVT